MTTPNHPTGGSVMPYQRYLDATHAARDQYLATTCTAHRMYLTGPYPDRETYQQVENTAWQVYYQAARTAWQRYTTTVGSPGEPPAPRHSPDLEATWTALETAHGPNCPECGIPWRSPSPGCPHRINNVHPQGPAFTETNGGNH